MAVFVFGLNGRGQTIVSKSQTGNLSVAGEKWQKGGIFEGFTPEQEILEKRTSNTKHFQKNNGDIVAQIGDNYHYQDENTQWQDIDFTITKTNDDGFAYSNITNSFKTYFPENAGDNGVAIKDKSIDVTILKNPELLIWDANKNIIYRESSLNSAAQVKNNIARYQSFNGVVDEIKIIENGIENNIIINSLQGQWTNLPGANMLSFKQFVALPKGVKILNAKGNIATSDFTDEYIGLQFADGQTLYLNPLVVFDAQGNKEDAQLFYGIKEKDKIPAGIKAKANSFYKGSYTIKFVENGIEIYSDVSLEWLQEAQYPVTVDPTWTIGSILSGSYYCPLSNWFGFQRCASLYLQSEISGYGTISQIEYYKIGTETARTKPTKVYLRNFPSSTITSVDAWNSTTYTSGATACYNNSTTQGSTAGWKAIPLSSSHNYTSGNLLVMVYDEYGGGGSFQSMAYENATGLQTKKRADYTDPGDGTAMETESYRGSIRITYTSSVCPNFTGSSTGYYITNFTTTGATSNVNNTTTGTGQTYNDYYNSQSFTAAAGSTINTSVTTTSGTYGVSIWVDWNNNGTFEVGEKVYGTSSYTSSPITGSFAIPAGQALGSYRVRVMADWLNSAPNDPCVCNTGEVEDYKLIVVAACATPATPTASVTVQPTCAVSMGTIVITNPIGATYEYQLDAGTYQASATFTGVAVGTHTVKARLAATPTCISSASSSMTVNAQPVTPSLPITGTHSPSETQIIWNWNAVSGATGYKWNITNSYATATDLGNVLTKTETGLTCATGYSRYIWAYNTCGNSTALNLNSTTTACPPRPCAICTPEDVDLGTIGTTVYGFSQSGNLGNGGKYVAKFTGEAGSIYHFDLCPDAPGSGTNNLDIDIKVTDVSCNIITGVDGSCSSPTYAPNDWQWTCPSNGTYYIILAPYSSYASHTCNGTVSNTFNMYYYKETCVAPSISGQPTNQSSTACGNATFSVTTSGATPSFQWQVSTDGGTVWADISAAGSNPTYSGYTSSSLTLSGIGVNGGYKYRCYISNFCGNVTSNVATLTLTYGTASNTICGNRYIWNFTYGGINKTTTTTCTGSPSFYNSYTETATVNQGISNTVNISPGTTDNSTYFKVWIDYNDNNTFEDAGENVYSFGPGNVASSSITASGTAGTHKMRVRSSNTTGMTSCNTQPQGETEDYNITIIPCAPTTQAQSITFPGVYNTRLDINWTNGNGTRRAVFMKAASSGTAAPVDGTTYTASTTFGSGTQIGSTGWYCIYDGTGGGPLTIYGLSVSTTYRVQVFEYNFCPATSPKYYTVTATGNPNNQTTTNNTYCTATSTYYDEYISNVILGSINNLSDSTAPYNGYSDYTSLVSSISQGVSYPLSVVNGFPYSSDKCGVWVDWNQDQDFDDTGEQIYVTGSPGTGPYTALINPQLTTPLGNTRIRIRIVSDGDALTPCTNSFLGETEDYTLNITSGNPCNPIVFSDACEASTGWALGSQSSGTSRNKWAVSSCNAISNNSLTVLGSTDNGVNYSCTYGYAELTTANIIASRPVNASGYNTLKLGFKWKSNGETNQDYGMAVYSTNGGSTWNDVSSAKYQGQATTQTVSNLALPAACENISFLLGFRWIQTNSSAGNDPPFTVDDIYITGLCGSPLPGPAGTISGTSVVCAGQTGVSYSVAPITNATGYSWSVPAGASIISGGNTNTITVNYAAGASSGNITVYGTNGSGNGATSPAFAVTVNNVPVASGAIAGTATVCEGLTIAYSVAAISGATSYSWNTPSGYNIISGMGTNSVTINFSSNASTGVISVTGSNMCGNGTSSANYAVTVNPLPTNPGTISGTANVCQGQNGVLFSVPAITYTTGYTWTLPSGASIATGANTNSITVNFSGTAVSGDVYVAGTNACGSGLTSAAFNVTVGAIPAAAGTIQGYASVCQGNGGYTYYIPVISGATNYTWLLPSGASITSGSGTNMITVAYSNSAVSGNVSVYASNSCGNGVSSANYPVVVTPLVANAGSITGTATVCQGVSGVTYTVPAIAGASSYVWTLPSGVSITSGNGSASITVSYSSTAVSGNISVYGTNSCYDGLTSPNYAVTVNQSSIVPSAASASPGSIAIGMSSMLDVSGGYLGTGAVWKWYTGSCGGIWAGTGSSISVSPTTTTTYYVRAEGGACGPTTCESVTVVVSPVGSYYGAVSNGAMVYIGTGCYVYIDGGTNGDYNNNSYGSSHGSIELDGKIIIEGDWYNNTSNGANAFRNIEPSPDGWVEFRDNITQSIGGTSITSFENVMINNNSPATGDNINLVGGNTVILNTLDLTDGVIKTGVNKLIIENTASNAITNYSNASFINGNLRRYIKTANGSYAFPLGYGGNQPVNYFLAEMENNLLVWSGTRYLDSKVAALSNSTDADLVTANVIELGTQYVSMATQAMWTLTPDMQPTGNYNIRCWITNIKATSPLSDNSFAVLKRTDGSNGTQWSKGNGTINANGGSGRMLTDDFAYRKSVTTGFSEFAISKSQGPLPIELLDFNAFCINNKVSVNWTTSSETNNNYFTIERSKDANLWTDLTDIPAAGNSNWLISYNYSDNEPLGINSFYRLKQTDFDGMFTYSPSTMVDCKEDLLMAFYGYIFNDYLNISITSPESNGYLLFLFDDKGNLVTTKTPECLEGINSFNYDISNLSTGIYLIVLQDKDKVLTQKIMIH